MNAQEENPCLTNLKYTYLHSSRNIGKGKRHESGSAKCGGQQWN
jgi:hypothetical protein